MTRSHVRSFVSIAALVLATASVASAQIPPLGTNQRTLRAPTCEVIGHDRICGAEGGSVLYRAAVSPAGTYAYSWSLHTTTTDGCPGTGTTSPSFCGPTDQSTVCVVPGTSAGRFVLKVVVSDGAAQSTCCLSINVTPSTSCTVPPPASICQGATQTFCASPSGTGPFTYVWSRNGVPIPGATNACYTATAGPNGTIDQYCVTATGSGVCAVPYTACTSLTSLAQTTAASLPAVRRCEGGTFAFCTTPGGSGPFAYSWTRNGVPIPGATSGCYTATAGAPGSADAYCVTVTGPCGPPVVRCGTLTTNDAATAAALTPATACAGAATTFCTTPGGTGPFTYSWTRNGVPIPGATSSCYAATAGVAGSVDAYCVNVTGACGTAQSCATLTSVASTTASALPPSTACAGVTRTFCTVAGGTGPFTYAWRRNGTVIPGATDSCYTATAGVAGTVDDYCAIVSGACGSPAMACATLTATAGTTATDLAAATGCEGATQLLCTTAGGSGPFTYAWTRNGAPIAGATSSCYLATFGVGGATDAYCVTVTGACGVVERCAGLASQPPTTTASLNETSGCADDPVTLCATAGGTGPFTYQWSRNGSAVPGETGSCYAFDLAASDSQVCVTVTGSCGPPATACATLAVQGCGGGHLTLTQGAYGNAGGQLNGTGRLALIESLLQGGITVGVLGTRSLTFQPGAHDAQCVLDRLPTSGRPMVLPSFGDEQLEADCQTSPTPLPLVAGRFENILLGQVITLSLNVELSQGFLSSTGCATLASGLESQAICATMVSRKLLPGPDGCIGTADDVPDLQGLDGNPATPDNLATLAIQPAVLDSLAALSLPQTVGGLLELGNRALAGLPIGTATLADVSGAVDSINVLYDEGRELLDCTTP